MKKSLNIFILFFIFSCGSDADVKDRAFFYSVRKNDIRKIEESLNNGAYINGINLKGETALMTAAEKDSSEALALLIKKGADIEMTDMDGINALMKASAKGSPNAVKILIENGANLNKKNPRGETALMMAVKNGRLEIAGLLAGNRAELNLKDSRGNTALMFASYDNKTDLLKLLIECKADIFLRDKQLKTAYQQTVMNKQSKASLILAKAAGDILFLMNDIIPLKEILQNGLSPGIKPDYKYPCTKQSKTGCFGYAVKHIVMHKYDQIINVDDSDKIIGRDTVKGWDYENIQNFLDLHELDIDYRYNSNELFSSLMQGEPLIIWYKISEEWGHWVAAYSFDDKGLWISESISNKRINLSYDRIFEDSGIETLGYFMAITK